MDCIRNVDAIVTDDKDTMSIVEYRGLKAYFLLVDGLSSVSQPCPSDNPLLSTQSIHHLDHLQPLKYPQRFGLVDLYLSLCSSPSFSSYLTVSA